MPDLNVEERALLTRQISRAGHLSTDRLVCRVGGDRHHWVQCQPDYIPQVGVAIAHQCSVCNGIKRAVVAPRSGEVLACSYQYPAGYQLTRGDDMEPGERTISAASVRVALLGRDRDFAPLRGHVPEE